MTDTYDGALERARGLGVTIVDPDSIYDVECNIFAPCALGGVLNKETVPRLRCAIVAGGANNQLSEESDGEALHHRRVVYAPDYVVNAGGIINVACEIGGEYRQERAKELTERIYDSTENVLDISRKENVPTSVAADRLAERRLDDVRRFEGMHR